MPGFLVSWHIVFIENQPDAALSAIHGNAQVVRRHDVIAAKRTVGFVAGQLHRDGLGSAFAHEVADGGTSQS